MDSEARGFPKFWSFASLPDGRPKLEYLVDDAGHLQAVQHDWPGTPMAFKVDEEDPPKGLVLRFSLGPLFPERLDGCFRLVSSRLAPDFDFQPIGRVVLYLLVEHFRLAPALPAHVPLFTAQDRLQFMGWAKALFNATLETMHTMNAVLRDDRRRPELREWFRTRATQHITRAAKLITHCLVMLQTTGNLGYRQDTTCLRENCRRRPMSARRASAHPKDILLYAHCRVRNRAPALSPGRDHQVFILPPTRDTDPPMLCDRHQYVFRTLIYEVFTLDWHDRNFDRDARLFDIIDMSVGWNEETQSPKTESPTP